MQNAIPMPIADESTVRCDLVTIQNQQSRDLAGSAMVEFGMNPSLRTSDHFRFVKEKDSKTPLNTAY